MDTTFIATAVDTAAAHAAAAQAFTALITALLPGLDAKAQGSLVGLLSGGVVVGLVFLWRCFIHLLQKPERLAWITPIWMRYRGVVNILLALLGGEAVGGSWVTGAVAVVLHQLKKGLGEAVGKVTPEGQSRARHVGLSIIFGALLLGASATPAHAVRLVPAAGFAVEHSLNESSSAKGLFLVQVRAALSDHLNTGVRVAGPITWTADDVNAAPFQFDWRRPRISYEVLWVF